MHDFEETINDIVGTRLKSLNALRARTEELVKLQTQEEELMRASVQHLAMQSEHMQTAQRDMEVEYESALQRERKERDSILKLMASFKSEGSQVIRNWKDSVKTLQRKYEMEVDKNARLSSQVQQLRQQLRQMDEEHGTTAKPTRSSPNNDNSNNNSNTTGSNALLYDKVTLLSNMLEEEDAIIVELRKRNKTLDRKVRTLQQQRQNAGASPLSMRAGSASGGGANDDSGLFHLDLLGVDAEDDGVSEFLGEELRAYTDRSKTLDRQLKQLIQQAPGQPDLETQRLLEQQVNALKRLTLLLMQKLKVEQRQRLKVEEQSIKMAGAQEQLIKKMEMRIKEASAAPAAAVAGSGDYRSTAPSVAVPQIVPQPTRTAPKNSGPADVIREPKKQEPVGLEEMLPTPPSHRQQQQRPQQQPVAAPTDRSKKAATVSQSPPKRVSPPVISDDEEISTDVPKQRRQQTTKKADDNETPRRLLSLEEQLAMVSRDFEESMQQWADELDKELDGFTDEDFLPLEEQ